MEVEQQDVVLAASTSEQTIGVWDVKTTTFLTAFKGNTSGPNALALAGSDFLLAAQAGKGQAINAWAWQKEQNLNMSIHCGRSSFPNDMRLSPTVADGVHLRSYTPEAVAAIACTSDGVLCAAGSSTGSVFVWEAASGRLLRTFPAHYKCVSVLRFTDDSAVLITGGEDAIVSAWLLMDLLDQEQPLLPGASPEPFRSWTQHTLPITGLYVGAGGANPIVASASLDCCSKIWSLASGRLLRSVVAPAALRCVAADPWERALYLGAADGRIFEATLAGGGSGEMRALAGHRRAVTGLAPTSTGYCLVSGSEDASLRVWDLQTRQTLRVIQAKAPVSAILVLPKPLDLNHGRWTESGRPDPRRQQPLGVFQKFPDDSDAAAAHRTSPVVIDGTRPYRNVIVNWLEQRGAAVDCGLLRHAPDADGSGAAAGADAERLAAENERLQAQLASAARTIADMRALNAELHSLVSDPAL